jgi:hypothetical protein
MIAPPLPNFTGKADGVFYVEGTNTKRLVEWAEGLKLLRFPSIAVRNWCLGQGPRPMSVFDSLPDDSQEVTQ